MHIIRKFIIISTIVLFAGCSTTSGGHVCRSKSAEEQAAIDNDKKVKGIADSYRITHNENMARYTEMDAKQRGAKSNDSSFNLADLIADITLEIFFGKCDK